jgi:hypothetical protein
MGRKFGLSFSWKRALGISAAKARLSRKIGIPLTKSGRQRMAGRALGCGLACLALAVLLLGIGALAAAASGLLNF